MLVSGSFFCNSYNIISIYFLYGTVYFLFLKIEEINEIFEFFVLVLYNTNIFNRIERTYFESFNYNSIMNSKFNFNSKI